MTTQVRAFYKIKNAIQSCYRLSQLQCCERMIDRFTSLFNNEERVRELQGIYGTQQNILEVNNCYETV